MSKDCGLSAAAEQLNGAIDSAKGAVDDLIGTAVGGIADSVDGLLDKVTDLTDGIKGDLEAAVPEIELPEAKLQDQMTELLSTNDPGKQIEMYAEIKEKFGNVPGVDLDKIMDDFGLDSKALNAGLDDYNDKLGKGNKLKEKLGGALDKIESVADSDLVKLASGDLSVIGSVVGGFADKIFGGKDKTGLLEKVCTKLPSLEKEPPQDYVIQKGDTLTSIAKANNTTVDALVELNNIEDPDKIIAGDTIKIPGKVVEKGPEEKAPEINSDPPEVDTETKTDVTPPDTSKTQENAEKLVNQTDEEKEVDNFDYGKVKRNEEFKTDEYQKDIKLLQEINEKRNKLSLDQLQLELDWERADPETRGIKPVNPKLQKYIEAANEYIRLHTLNMAIKYGVSFNKEKNAFVIGGKEYVQSADAPPKEKHIYQYELWNKYFMEGTAEPNRNLLRGYLGRLEFIHIQTKEEAESEEFSPHINITF